MAKSASARSTAAVPSMPRIITNLTVRERRVWQRRLTDKVEAAEKAVEAIDEEALAAYEAGMSYAMVGGILGVHSTTTKDMCDRALRRRGEGGSEDSR